MRNILLSSAAVFALVAFAPAVNAQDNDGLNLGVGGYVKGYGAVTDQDENNGEVADVDMLRRTEIHLTGETTLDNGLTVGARLEANADTGDSFNLDESFVYFSGGWGRVNLGDDDGAAYLLQVSAPSADANIDGIRQFVQPVNYTVLGAGALGDQFDYDNDSTTNNNKITYLTPNVQGLQAGVSYTPDLGGGTRSLDGVGQNDTAPFDEAWGIAARYEGEVDKLGFNLGAGYTTADEPDGVPANDDDLEEWNIGADFDWGPFGLGAVYTESNNGNANSGRDDNETWVLGLDYTTGPFKVGGSYYNNEDDTGNFLGAGNAGNELETDRYTGGVTYSYGPGMSLRGSVSYIDHEVENITPFGGDDEADATSFMLGTQVTF